jgi:hypothetical protein
MKLSQSVQALGILCCFGYVLFMSGTSQNNRPAKVQAQTISQTISQATPPTIPQPVTQTPAFQEELAPFYKYLHEQKYHKPLGSDRGACEYQIDPSDVYAQGDRRFVTAKVSRGGNAGTGCRGILEFEVFEINCKEKKIYSFDRETTGDPRTRGWLRSTTTFNDTRANSFSDVTTRSAEEVCAMPAKS